MRENGIEAAIQAAGGVNALARALGISQASVSGWLRVPPERAIQIERIFGLPREVMRPDLYEGMVRVDGKRQKARPTDTAAG